MTFLSTSLDWFLGNKSSHMGPDQYVAHSGVRNGQLMSGPYLWARSEAETISAAGNMVNAETGLLQEKVVNEIGNHIPPGTAIIELGPGTTTAFRNKTLPIISKLESNVCVLVDESMAFLEQIVTTRGLRGGA